MIVCEQECGDDDDDGVSEREISLMVVFLYGYVLVFGGVCVFRVDSML